MQALRHWTFGKVLLASAAWFFLSLFVLAGWLLSRGSFAVDAIEGGGVGSASIAISDLVFPMLAIPVVPPIVLIAAWLVGRRLRAD